MKESGNKNNTSRLLQQDKGCPLEDLGRTGWHNVIPIALSSIFGSTLNLPCAAGDRNY